MASKLANDFAGAEDLLTGLVEVAHCGHDLPVCVRTEHEPGGADII